MAKTKAKAKEERKEPKWRKVAIFFGEGPAMVSLWQVSGIIAWRQCSGGSSP